MSRPSSHVVRAEPVRTCVGCRERAATSELVRLTAGSDRDGHPVVVPDLDGSAPGRGAHLHPTTACFDLAVRRRVFVRALRLDRDAARQLATTPVADYLASLDHPGTT